MARSSSSALKKPRGTGVRTSGLPALASLHESLPSEYEAKSKRLVRRNKMLMAKYGLTLDQFEKMLLIQRGKCGICDRFFHGVRRMYVDHDHQSGRVRGILCYPCNHRLLGRGLEDPFVHERAAAYLRSTFDGRNLGKGELN